MYQVQLKLTKWGSDLWTSLIIRSEMFSCNVDRTLWRGTSEEYVACVITVTYGHFQENALGGNI